MIFSRPIANSLSGSIFLRGFFPKGLAGLCLALTGAAQANQLSEDIADALQPYARAEIIESSEEAVVDYPVALGQVEKRRGIWAPEKERRMAGDRVRVTMEIPEGHSASEVFRFYRRRLNNIEARILFRCEERNCGPSNSWANEIFKVKQLYGLDGDQYYAAFELEDEQNHLNFVMLYTVTRGNRRVMAHTELLKTNLVARESVAPDPKLIREQLYEQGFYVVSGLEQEDGGLIMNPEHLAALVDALRGDRRLSVRIVGHDYSDSSLDEQISASETYAAQLADLLTENRVPEARLSVHGVGSLSPVRNDVDDDRQTGFRVELVPY